MKILGLDLGTNSIGWAVVEKDGDEVKLEHKGVRIFQEGVKIEKGVEGSKAAERTKFRSARRLKYRRKLRKISTLKVLSEYGYCPDLTVEELDNWRYNRIYPDNKLLREWWLTDDKTNKTPYYFRNLAVTRQMNLDKEEDRFILGRAFYHMAQRRGFLSNRLETKKESDGVVTKSISQLSELKGDLTLGQYFYQKYLKNEKIRDVYTHREEHYLDEFRRICEYQNLPSEFAHKLERAIYYQRPLKSQKGTIGKCVFETNKSRCPVSRPEYEEYRMLCFINNVKIKTPDDEKLRFLNEDERNKVFPVFFRKSKDHFTFEDIAKLLAPKGSYKYYRSSDVNPQDWLFNYHLKTTVSGCPFSARLKSIFGDDYMDLKINYTREKDGKLSQIDIDDIWHALYTFDSNEKLKDFAENRLGLNEPQLKEFLNLKLKREYASLSLKAIRKILPYLRKGYLYSHAVFMANMEAVLPENVWAIKENREIINQEVLNIIDTHSDEKRMADAVNALIKECKDEEDAWSDEASQIYKNQLIDKLVLQFGQKKYESFSEERKQHIEEDAFDLFSTHMAKNLGKGEFVTIKRIDERIKDFLRDNFDIDETKLNKLYHPSAMEVYKPPQKGKDGKYYLGSPMVSSIRNPMAMRALHQLRVIINEMIKEGYVDSRTRVNIEMSRGLLNANERRGLQMWQMDNEKKRKEYIDKIKEHLGENSEPTNDQILKYQLWEEQNHKCVYTGNEISMAEFLGPNPRYDIEHTVPRSLSYDNSQENKTLCENKYNRSVKRNRIPNELENHTEILERIKHWKDKFESLNWQIEKVTMQVKASVEKESKDRAIQKRHRLRYERDYWKNKYQRFIMAEVPQGFKNSQLVDTGVITKYSRLYLKTYFDKVYTVKGSIVADFRKMWGLQDIYEKKERVNHIHHCIDAITMACISKKSYEDLARFYHDYEELFLSDDGRKPQVDKPWDTFTEDVKSVEDEVLVSHYTPDVLPKQTKKKWRKRGKIQYNEKGEPIYLRGDTVRGSLHQETFYGAIERKERNKNGEEEKQIRYVVRKPLDGLDDSSLKNIVDRNVREIVIQARAKEKELKKVLDSLNIELRNAEEWEEPDIRLSISEIKDQIAMLYALPNRGGTPIPIKKVRIYKPEVTNPIFLKQHRDKSQKSEKSHNEHYHVANDENYLIAIYEGKNEGGKIKRSFEIVNNLEAGEFFKESVHNTLRDQGIGEKSNLFSSTKNREKFVLLPKSILKIGTMVILWQNEPTEVWELTASEIKGRLYKIIGLSVQRIKSSNGKINEYATIVMRHHQEARPSKKLKTMDGLFEIGEANKSQRKLNHNQFNALVENFDFKITPLGEIIKM